MLNDIDALVEKAHEPLDNMWLDFIMSQAIDSSPVRLIYYRFLYHLMLLRKPQVALELGVEFGVASAFMVEAAKTFGGLVIGIDMNWNNIPGELVRDYCGNYEYITGDTLLSFPLVRDICVGKLGVVFQDSSHHYNASITEWDLYTSILDTDAVWVCDDIHRSFHDPLIDPPGKGMLEYFHSRPGVKKLYPELYGKGVENAVGVILC
jgi:hypothetical protein